MILRGYYRFYLGNWGLKSHTASLEVPIKITPYFSLTPFYTYYVQTTANYFAAYEAHSPQDKYYTSNYALAAFSSQSFGMGVRIASFKGILIKSLSVLELRYGHYAQRTNLASDIISLNLKFR